MNSNYKIGEYQGQGFVCDSLSYLEFPLQELQAGLQKEFKNIYLGPL